LQLRIHKAESDIIRYMDLRCDVTVNYRHPRTFLSCLSCRCIAGMEQPTTCHPKCFILHSLSATTEDTSV